jgi:hypothetical protein
MYMTII